MSANHAGRAHLLTAILAFLFCAASGHARTPTSKEAKKGADTIVLHGRIYTLNSRQPWAQALAIRADRIVAVGDDAAVSKFRGAGTKIIDAAGQLVLPGF